MSIIHVNTLCRINDSNPTPVKDQEIALNVTAVAPKADFQNFVLGIADHEQCCETYGTFADDVPETLFVKYIENDIVPTGERIKELLPWGVDLDSIILYKLVDEDDNEYFFGVYNQHNGYYAHVIWQNGKQIDYL